MVSNKSLCQFLVKAKKTTYASGDSSKEIKEKDGSTSLIYKQGDWKYHDNFFGGEPFGGREVVFYKGKPVYIMVYYGWVSDTVSDFQEIYAFLPKALSQIPKDKPFRGPKLLKQGKLCYKNVFQGGVERFSGKEIIAQDKKIIFQTKYIGGLVDIK